MCCSVKNTNTSLSLFFSIFSFIHICIITFIQACYLYTCFLFPLMLFYFWECFYTYTLEFFYSDIQSLWPNSGSYTPPMVIILLSDLSSITFFTIEQLYNKYTISIIQAIETLPSIWKELWYKVEYNEHIIADIRLRHSNIMRVQKKVLKSFNLLQFGTFKIE